MALAQRQSPRRQSPRRRARGEREQTLRKERILDVAIRLAEQGGFENVRQRDVAELAGVALGTLYKSFRSKEDILSAALERVITALETRLQEHPLTGADPAERVGTLFATLTKALCRKPNYARAVLRAMTSGERAVSDNVVAHQSHVAGMVLAALRGPDGALLGDVPPTQDELDVALLMQQVWFASLVGWSAGLHSQAEVERQVRVAARLFLAGLPR